MLGPGPTRTDPGSELADRRRRLRESLRAAFMAGAEEESMGRLGRPLTLTRAELERVLRRYPVD